MPGTLTLLLLVYAGAWAFYKFVRHKEVAWKPALVLTALMAVGWFLLVYLLKSLMWFIGLIVLVAAALFLWNKFKSLN